ncbi:MAG: HAMP domain-containing protein [Spirochaetes bacterium]|nr:HAMP domain-containing protein [Spirochaetota bacterium]
MSENPAENKSDNIKEKKQMSRLKKKLMIYFLLITIVSLSVGAQIILEVSSPKFQSAINDKYISAIQKNVDEKTLSAIKSDLLKAGTNTPIRDMRNRMILLLLVVTFSIIAAFNLFTRDIVVPMDGLVDATKKLAAGDLSAHVPVLSEDEIGQMAGLVNDMNINLQDMIKQIKRELDNYNFKIALALGQIDSVIRNDVFDNVIKNKKIKVNDFKKIMETSLEVETILNKMSDDLTALHSFIGSYNSYSIPSQITQKEIDETLKHYGKSN